MCRATSELHDWILCFGMSPFNKRRLLPVADKAVDSSLHYLRTSWALASFMLFLWPKTHKQASPARLVNAWNTFITNRTNPVRLCTKATMMWEQIWERTVWFCVWLIVFDSADEEMNTQYSRLLRRSKDTTAGLCRTACVRNEQIRLAGDVTDHWHVFLLSVIKDQVCLDRATRLLSLSASQGERI